MLCGRFSIVCYCMVARVFLYASALLNSPPGRRAGLVE